MGGAGAKDLAHKVVAMTQNERPLTYAYELDIPIQDKLTQIVQKVYGGTKAIMTPAARREARQLEALGFDKLPICMAKTQYSFSDNPKLLGAPEGFEVIIRSLKVSAGAGFIVALTGDIMTMPGLPKVPSAESIDIDADGTITGLF